MIFIVTAWLLIKAGKQFPAFNLANLLHNEVYLLPALVLLLPVFYFLVPYRYIPSVCQDFVFWQKPL